MRLDYGSLPTLCVKPIHLQHVFHNLLSNAIKYGSPTNSEINIGVESESPSGMKTVFVRDNGPGIAEEDREHIFAMFARSGTDREEIGLGIGLAYCRRVIESYGGKIWVESKPGQGSTFRFTLPEAREPEQQ